MPKAAQYEDEKLLVGESNDLEDFQGELKQSQQSLPRHLDVDPDNVERGLAKLVLTLIELLRRLMERQALHRIDSGSLTEEEIERLGETFLKLDARMEELIQIFDLEDEELNLDLGPLGRLL